MANIPTTAWDETAPTGTVAISGGDDRIRELKTQLREIFEIDHVMSSSGQDTDWGRHKVVQLKQQDSSPASTTDVGKLFSKDVGGIPELFYRDDAANDTQITSAGSLYGKKYSEGTVTVTNASTAVVGAGTTWSTNVSAGDVFRRANDTETYTIATVTDDTNIVLDRAYVGVTGSAKSYDIGIDDYFWYVKQGGDLTEDQDAGGHKILDLDFINGSHVYASSEEALPTDYAASDLTIDLTITSTSSVVLVDASITTVLEATGATAKCQIYVDAAVMDPLVYAQSKVVGDNTVHIPLSLTGMVTGLSAGSHTFAVYWKDDNTGAKAVQRMLRAVEFIK
jgi:hypothetical protein